jgi:FixJ family two-component response regulator
VPTKELIAIVDDDSSVREGVTDLLNSIGFVTEAFKSAEDFLASNLRTRVACLITDGRMSGMTGFELHHHLVVSGERIPTILLTAFPEEADRARALREGMFCYLPKPFNDNELLGCLRSAIAANQIGD